MNTVKSIDKRTIKGEATKAKIINAGIELFSKKGFDAASVNDISKKAKLTKSLVYHHFKNKDEILKTIIDNYQKILKNKLDNILNQDKIINLDEFLFRFKDSIFEFLSENKKILKIFMAESYKNKIFTNYLFKTFENFISYFAANAEKISKDKICTLKTGDFFFHLIPLISFSIFQDSWCEYYNENPNRAQSDFFQVFYHLAELLHK